MSRWLLATIVLGGCLLAALSWHARTAPAQPSRPRNLILVSVDTLRADHLPFYGYHRQTAPGLFLLGQDAAVFLNAFACSSTTLPSHVSMMTGLHPSTHGVLSNSDGCSAQALTLAEILHEAGFSTAAFVGATVLAASTGLAQGFEVYDDDVSAYFNQLEVEPAWRAGAPFFPQQQVPADDVLDRALRWLGPGPKTPFFLFVHLYDPHSPYVPPAGHRQTFVTPGGDEMQRLRDLYDCEIYYADLQLQRLWRALERQHLKDETLVVFTSDHGEGLGDHQYLLHAGEVYDEQLHVPLLMWGPGVPKKKVNDLVDLTDLFPTVLQLLGLSAPPSEGNNLVRLLRGENPTMARAFAYGQRPPCKNLVRLYLLDGHDEVQPLEVRYLRSDKAKLLLPTPGKPLLFDLVADPSETRDVSAQQPQLTRQYLGLLERPFEKPLPALAPVSRALSPEERERLRSLGYLAP